LIYCGALTYKANFDAVWYFLKDVFPLIQAKIPDVSFAITGDYKGVPTEKLPKHQNVQFTGYLQDVRPAIRQSWISVVPLRIGGGTRLKILESLALGTPVISTSKGAEGLELQPGRDIIIADTPAVMAAQVIGLLKDQALRNLLSENGKKIIAEKYNWDVNKKSYDNFLNRCLSNK
jgi:glycosyltransferase involved in cell wall biosynthesis